MIKRINNNYRVFGLTKIISKQLKNFIKRTKNNRQKVIQIIDRRPLLSFFVVLALLLGLIVASNLWPQPQTALTPEPEVKGVGLYRIGESPKITVQAQIKKSGVITIASLTPGVIQSLNVIEGQVVKKGQNLLSLSSNYQGGNAASLQRLIAANQYKSISDTFPLQKELIGKQKELAQKTDENADKLRDITSKSLDETRNLINLNEEILRSLDANLATLRQTVPATDSAILALQQQKSQILAVVNQGKSALRNSEYQASSDDPAAKLSDLNREVVIKQLEIQEKQLEINKEVSRLQLLLAQVQEGLYFPSSPFAAVVERVLVKYGEAVNPGTPLMVISQTVEDDPVSAIAFVSADIAKRTSIIEPSALHIGDRIYEATPYYISTEAVSGTLYAIYYPIPEDLNKEAVNNGFISVQVPIGFADTSSVVPFVPIDSIYQTRESSYVFVVENGKAKARVITLGQVYGRFVESLSGLSGGDQIILSRNIIEGDLVVEK